MHGRKGSIMVLLILVPVSDPVPVLELVSKWTTSSLSAQHVPDAPNAEGEDWGGIGNLT